MLKLRAKAEVRNWDALTPLLLTVTRNEALPVTIRPRYAYLSTGNSTLPDHYGALMFFQDIEKRRESNQLLLPADLNYLTEGDIIRVEGDGGINVIFRKNSPHNTFLLTERCNHYCLMCSQPPKKHDDSMLLEEALQVLEILPRETENIGFSGGEPTLYGARFIELIEKARLFLPETSIDVLTNGRAFSDFTFAQAFSEIEHPNCTLGIPLYSDDPTRHDYVVQSIGAFDETVRGIINLKQLRQKVEIRIVLHKQTLPRLVQTCEFIARNLLFVDHVALMGLEMMGFARANLESLWIDPYYYRDTLSEAISVLNTYAIPASVYNHQLCVVNEDVTENYARSISDWKNEYVSQCNGCIKKSACGGFFSSSKLHRYSDHITPFLSA